MSRQPRHTNMIISHTSTMYKLRVTRRPCTSPISDTTNYLVRGLVCFNIPRIIDIIPGRSVLKFNSFPHHAQLNFVVAGEALDSSTTDVVQPSDAAS